MREPLRRSEKAVHPLSWLLPAETCFKRLKQSLSSRMRITDQAPSPPPHPSTLKAGKYLSLGCLDHVFSMYRIHTFTYCTPLFYTCDSDSTWFCVMPVQGRAHMSVRKHIAEKRIQPWNRIDHISSPSLQASLCFETFRVLLLFHIFSLFGMSSPSKNMCVYPNSTLNLC